LTFLFHPCYTTKKPHNQANNTPSPKGCYHSICLQKFKQSDEKFCLKLIYMFKNATSLVVPKYLYNYHIIAVYRGLEYIASIGVDDKAILTVEDDGYRFRKGRFVCKFCNHEACVCFAEGFEGCHKPDAAAAVIGVGGNALFA